MKHTLSTGIVDNRSFTDATKRAVVIGGGPGGALTALRLLDGARSEQRQLEVVIVDPVAVLGRGTAFATSDQGHLLNVPVGNMSARQDDPEDFARWLTAAGLPTPPSAFVPRGLFGRYVSERLAEAALTGPATLHHLRARATALQPGSPRSTVTLDDGRCLEADAVVLALGTAPPDLSFAPTALHDDPRLVTDPWVPGALLDVPHDHDVLLIGTGLTMADIALSLARAGRRVHAISRHGLLPQAHLVPAKPAVPAPDLSSCADLDALRTAVLGHVASTLSEYGDWRPAIDGMRSQLQSCWQQLPLADRARFLREDLRAWEVRRHRMAPRTGEALEAAVADGTVVLHTGTLVATDDRDGRLAAHLSDGSSVTVGAVVACTGGIGALDQSDDPLLQGLLRNGGARPGPVGLGLDTAGDGRLRDADGHAHARIWTIGSLRRGNLWETTAIPEIRCQAAEVAAELLARTSDARTPVLPRDCYDLPLTTTTGAAEAFGRGLEAVLRVENGAVEHFQHAVAADPSFALGHATLALLGHEWGAEVDVAHELAAARSGRTRHERERSFIGAVRDHVENGTRTALLEHIATHPRDALAVSVAVPTVAFGGMLSGRDSWELVEALAPHYGDDWWYLAQLAFVRQDQGRFDDAERLATRSLEAQPVSSHAAHALTHAFYETGRHETGLSWLETWQDEHAAKVVPHAHFAWHAALHEVMLGDTAAVRRRYDRQLAPPVVSGLRALVDTASMLWRARVTGTWDADLPIAPVLDVVPRATLVAPATAFTALHSAFALAAADDDAGLAALGTHATGAGWAVVREIVDGLRAVLAERWADAVTALSAARSGLDAIGGSAAQHEVVEETLIHALLQAERHTDAAVVLSARLDRRPSPLDERRLLGDRVA